MAQAPHEALPTVKCSSCGQPVPLANLGDHVCPPSPPHLLSQKSAPTLQPQRLPSPATSGAPPHTPSSEKLPKEGEPVLSPSRDPFQRQSPDKSIMTTPKPTNFLSLDRDRSKLPGAPPPPGRVPTPQRDGIPPALQRVRFTSNTNRIPPVSPVQAAFPIQFRESATHPPSGRPTPLSLARRDNPPPLASPRSPFTDRESSNATPPSSIRPRPSFERAPTSSTVSTSRPSVDKYRPSVDKLHPSLDARRPSPDPQHTSTERNPPVPPGAPFARPPGQPVPSPGPGTIPFPSSAPILPPPVSARQPPPPPLSFAHSRHRVLDNEIDTKIGGEAGMAGVGRRGFAAAARAAMYAASRSPSRQPAHVIPGNGHRTNVPQYLDTNATFGHVMRGKSFI